MLMVDWLTFSIYILSITPSIHSCNTPLVQQITPPPPEFAPEG